MRILDLSSSRQVELEKVSYYHISVWLWVQTNGFAIFLYFGIQMVVIHTAHVR